MSAGKVRKSKTGQAPEIHVHKIPDPLLEGAARKLIIQAEMAVATITPFGDDENAVLDSLHECAMGLRNRLNSEGKSK